MFRVSLWLSLESPSKSQGSIKRSRQKAPLLRWWSVEIAQLGRELHACRLAGGWFVPVQNLDGGSSFLGGLLPHFWRKIWRLWRFQRFQRHRKTSIIDGQIPCFSVYPLKEAVEYPYIYIYIHIYTHKYIRIYLKIYIYIHTHIHIYTYTHISIYIYIYIYVYMYIHTYIYIYMHIYIYTYVHIWMHVSFLSNHTQPPDSLVEFGESAHFECSCGCLIQEMGVNLFWVGINRKMGRISVDAILLSIYNYTPISHRPTPTHVGCSMFPNTPINVSSACDQSTDVHPTWLVKMEPQTWQNKCE